MVDAPNTQTTHATFEVTEHDEHRLSNAALDEAFVLLALESCVATRARLTITAEIEWEIEMNSNKKKYYAFFLYN